jgi:hypothetical protein
VSADVVQTITPVDRVVAIMSAYERAMTLSKVEHVRRRGRIDESWHQGRGAFGRLLAAIPRLAPALSVLVVMLAAGC